MRRTIDSFLPFWSYRPAGGDRIAVTTRATVESLLVARVLEEPALRERLLSDPYAVLEREFGVVLPRGTQLQILCETDEAVHLILPHNPFAGVSEREMEAQYGLKLEEVAQWVLRDRRPTLLDEAQSVSITARAWRDEEFRRRFLEDPCTVLETDFGVKLPTTRRFFATSETAGLVCLVLPPLRSTDALELAPDVWYEANLGPQYVQVLAPSSFWTLGPPCPLPE